MARNCKSIFVLALLLLAGASPLRALEWTSDRFESSIRPLQSSLEVKFSFKNTSAKRVTIRAVLTNCDCLTAGPDKLTYEPGESGTITATFTVGDRYGHYERAITVVADDNPEPKRLSVRIEVPEPATTSPTILVWPVGAAPTEKAVELRAAAGVQINFAEAVASNAAFRVRIETVEAGRHYRLYVTPERTNAAANAAIRATGTTPEGKVIVTSAYANVR